MAKKNDTASPVVRMLNEKWEQACNAWLCELLNRWNLDAHYGYWVSDDVGGTYIYGDDLPLTMDEIRYCVTDGVSEQECREWLDYCTEAHEFNFAMPNIRAWHEGCPRTSPETFAHLREIKAMLDEAIQAEKDRQAQKTTTN